MPVKLRDYLELFQDWSRYRVNYANVKKGAVKQSILNITDISLANKEDGTIFVPKSFVQNDDEKYLDYYVVNQSLRKASGRGYSDACICIGIIQPDQMKL